MSNIRNIIGREILDSRGNPTVEAEISLESGVIVRAAVPSGASTGSREALELRDNDPKRYLGKGVLHAVKNINTEIRHALVGKNVFEQAALDHTLIDLDGTERKSRLGANAILAASLAIARAAAKDKSIPLYESLGTQERYRLPMPMMNIINGGAHANNNIDIQEFMIIPTGAPSFSEALRKADEVFQTLKKLLDKKGLNTTVGDEGGFAPQLSSNEAAIEIILEAITQAGYTPKKDFTLALDAASSEFYTDGKYNLSAENKILTADQLIELFSQWVDKYPITSIEDPLAENDWMGWKSITDKLGNRIQLIGDDIFVTNTKILQKGITEGIANAILIKPNQIGTLTETFAAIKLAKESMYNVIISHRSGETEDTTIADLAVAVNAGQIKTGSLCRTDRVAKYNQLLRIEEALGTKGYYR